MNPAVFVGCFLPLFVILIANRQRRQALAFRHAAEIRKKKGSVHPMEAIIRKYLGKTVTVTTVSDNHTGILAAYTDGWVTLEYKNKTFELNGDYIVKIEPLPEKKK